MREEQERQMKRRVRSYSNKIEPPLNLTDFSGTWMGGGRSGWSTILKLNNIQSPQNKPGKRQGESKSSGLGALLATSNKPTVAQPPTPHAYSTNLYPPSDTSSNPPGAWPSPPSSEDSWKANLDGIEKWYGYKSPIVEDAPETPQKEKSRYLNGYDENNETYLNAKQGG